MIKGTEVRSAASAALAEAKPENGRLDDVTRALTLNVMFSGRKSARNVRTELEKALVLPSFAKRRKHC